MSSRRGYVCGFYGARDNYQVPLALDEAGLLELLVTDFYGAGGAWARRGWMHASREAKALPSAKVRGSIISSAFKKIAGRLIHDLELRNHLPDRLLAHRIGRHAARRSAHIFTYEPYAVPRPKDGFPAGRKQVVFYYHPHVDTEDAIYRADESQWPEFYGKSEVTKSPWRRRTAGAWKQADLVLCASSFTKQSLVAVGMAEERIAVVPYGTAQPQVVVTGGESRVAGKGDPPTRGASPAGQGEGLRLLFVGRNPLRKGLHHLLMAWDAAKKQQGDLLTIVCAAKPAELRRLAEGRQDVRWLDSVSAEKLAELYAESDALVVPSLCEGFGHVYLEAMLSGCAVVGTRNSALPDIGDEKQGVFTVGVGDVDGLARLISDASSDPSIFRSFSENAKQRAGEFTWEGFRQGIVAAVHPIAA